MAAPWSMEVQHLIRLLDDGQWHNYHDVIDRLAARVAPGKALRRYEERTEYRRLRVGTTKPAAEPSEDEKIRYGQKVLAHVAFNSLRRRHLEDVDEGEHRLVRLKGPVPRFHDISPTAEKAPDAIPQEVVDSATQEVSEPVSDTSQHGSSEMALFSEEQVRVLVREEVSAALDAFQRRFQEWLELVLADMEQGVQTLIRGHIDADERE